MAHKAKLAIIGAGTAGLTALKEARRHTDDVILINNGPYGTTCARVGCMPSKALLAAAHGYHRRGFLAEAGIRGTEGLSADIPSLMEHVRELRDRFVAGPTRLARSLGERSLRGRPRFLDANTLAVGDERVEADAIVIATGSRPVMPAPWRDLGHRVLTTDDFFEQPDLGHRVAVVGLGAIGAELGQGLGQLGLEVHGYTRSVFVGGLSDPAVNEALIAGLERSMSVTTGADVALEAGDGDTVRVLANGDSREVDWVLAALGRRPNIDGLGLEALDVPLDDHGMPQFDPLTLRLGELPVYIAGDVNAAQPLMHEAADEGRIAAYHALNPDAGCVGRRTPLAIVFSEPQAARVGLGYAQLPAERFVTGDADFSGQGRAVMMGRNAGRLRVYADRHDGRLLGAEMAIPDGEHVAHLLAWAVEQRLSVDDALQMPFYHPVIEEGVRSALHAARRSVETARPALELPLCDTPAAWALGGEDPA
ncbi:dihydrolipoyl dehydrogenase [Arhodomonas aquaeolei]|uniref:dihydrolipoyl dehydrogenase n=1 Tax=Arhodomonas aquaeolei TaxID=2369 RepID=UPI00037B1A64|nr:dihydrolipoyl dehydrogenase [Arhodomonas aquaeolei]